VEEARQHSVVTGELEQLKRLLWEDWDPIGISGPDWPDDEYDSYAITIFGMLHRGADRDEIVAYLRWAEGENMGLQPSHIHEGIADAIFKIHEEAK
jgi:hypothetical protein